VALSLVEIKVITGLSEEQVTSEMSVIQDLFLVSRLRLIDGEPRFDVNTNTRRLILETYDKYPRLIELKERYKGLAGQLNVRKGDIQSYIQKAISLHLLQDYDKAEKLLIDALQRYPNNADLTAQLGVIYFYWRPNRRLTDARHQFKLAQQLGCQQEWMYSRWTIMESIVKDWARATEVADTAIKEGITSKELYALAGIAHSHLGNNFKSSFFFDKAEQEFKIADRLLRKGLKAPEHLINYSDRKLNSRVFRALVIGCDALGEIEDMLKFLDRWQHEHEDDPYASSEGQRLREKHSLLPHT
jgi:tetratricopeptide (TPR) repeat protein